MPAAAYRTLHVASGAAWYGRILLSEVRSFLHRIQIQFQKRHRRSDPIDLGPMYDELPSGEIVPCKATAARTQYVEFLLARFPWASDADIELALDGWDKGTKLILGNEGSECMREVETKDQYHLTLGQ